MHNEIPRRVKLIESRADRVFCLSAFGCFDSISRLTRQPRGRGNAYNSELVTGRIRYGGRFNQSAGMLNDDISEGKWPRRGVSVTKA